MQLEVKSLKSGYGKVQILHGVEIAIPAGEITSVLGANGAGKSTLMNTIAGHLPVMSGEIRHNGQVMNGHSPLQTCKAGVGIVPQDANVFAELSVKDNLRVSSLAFEGASERGE